MSDDLPLEGPGSTEHEPAMPPAYSGPVMAFLKQCFIFVVTVAVFSGGMWVFFVVDYGDSQIVSLLLFAFVLLLTGFTGFKLVARLRPYWVPSGESIVAEYEEAKARYYEAKERGDRLGIRVARAKLKKAFDKHNALLGREDRWAARDARQMRRLEQASEHGGQSRSSRSKRFPDRDSGGSDGGSGFGGGGGGFGDGGGGGCGGGGD